MMRAIIIIIIMIMIIIIYVPKFIMLAEGNRGKAACILHVDALRRMPSRCGCFNPKENPNVLWTGLGVGLGLVAKNNFTTPAGNRTPAV
jgi:hypothetical protein